MNPNNSFSATYQQEAMEQLALVEEIILEIEENSSDAEALNRLFRVFHTIKGSGAMFGFDEIASFTHHVETVLDQVRQGRVPVSRDLVTAILAAKDHISALMSDSEMKSDQALVLKLSSFLANASKPSASPSVSAHVMQSEGEGGSKDAIVYRIHFKPAPCIFSQGIEPATLLDELRSLGTADVALCTSDIPVLDLLDPEKCHLAWTINLRSCGGLNAIRDVFIFVEDDSSIRIEQEESKAQPALSMVAAPRLESSATDANANEHFEPPAHDGASARQPHARNPLIESAVRVPSTRLDRLVSLVGELVINHSRLNQISGRALIPELASSVEDLDRLISELRDNVLGIRMMPIGATFSRFKRLVRDLSGELKKEIELITEGEDTELDKTVLDQLGDPLVHLIRNAIDHGIGTPEERERAGKPRKGFIRLTASHEGAHVIIKIMDDGRGLDKEAIRKKALERKLLALDAKPSDSELFNLIFLPGFSTAKTVTNLSGRGVGMDVVKRQIDALRGAVSLSSEPGHGTRVTLTLPLTLAIIDGLLVEIDGDRFILPMSIVNENVELTAGECATGNGRNLVALRGELVPYLRLREIFCSSSKRPDIERIVIVNADTERVGLVVDRILGTHQTVIQSLGRFYRNVSIFSGATIMGDGKVALILDVAGLVSCYGRLRADANAQKEILS